MQQEIEKKSTHGYQFESSIPVLRMLDEARAKAFYIDYLGFEIDWEHRFEAATTNSPLYMQIHQGDAVIHLNGHAEQRAGPHGSDNRSLELGDFFCILLVSTLAKGAEDEP